MHDKARVPFAKEDRQDPLLDQLRQILSGWDESRPIAELIAELKNRSENQRNSGRNRKTGKSMSRRKGQNGSRIEKHGEYFTSRVWMDVPGQELRIHPRIKISPIDRNAPGWLNKPQRENRLREMIAHMGANSEERFNEVVKATQNGVITFGEQGKAYLQDLKTRGDHGAAKSTLDTFSGCLKNWLNPLLADLPLSQVNNGELKRVVARMKQNGLSPWMEQQERKRGRSEAEIAKMAKNGLAPLSIHTYVTVAKLVVASAVDPKSGEQLFPRRWNNKFIDLPKVSKNKMNTPAFTSATMAAFANYRSPRERELFIDLGATGMRISEMLAVEIGKHISADFRTITIAQQIEEGKAVPWLKTDAAYRQVEEDSAIAARLKKFVGNRPSGFLFQTRTGKPLHLSSILHHLHRALKEQGFVNPFTHDHKAGNHAFRRYRNTWLRNHTRCPEGLRKFWLGHADEDMGDLYDKIREDLAFRLTMAEECGHGFNLPDLVPTVPRTG